MLHLNLNKRFEAFLEIADHCGLIEDLNSIKLYKDRLELLKIGGVVLSLFYLVLGVPSKLVPDLIDKGLGVPKVFLKKGLKLWLYNWSGAFVTALMLGSFEAGGAAEESGGK